LKTGSFNFDFVGKRKIWFIVSAAVILVGITGYFVQGGFNLGIDFLGGSLMEVEFTRDVNVSEIREIMEDIGFGNTILQKTADDRFIVRTTPIDIKTKNMILETLDKEIGINRPPVQDRSVFPGFGRQIAEKALIAIGVSILGILIYVWIRFEFRFGTVAIFALLHDVLVTLGVYAISNREINTATIAAILTILGYSLNDTIVVFDRIRENTPAARKLGYGQVINDSVNKTLIRSINTSVTTLFPVILLLTLGSPALKDFAFALAIGIISGTYSSIFFASPVLVAWNNKFPRYKK
jgi:preprotein translocase subunit SecF